MTDPASPLQAIHQRELALRRQLEAARRQAEAQIQEARTEAERLIAQADQEGRAAAEACHQQGLEQAQHEAEAMVTAAQAQAMALCHRTMARLHEVADHIVELVLPRDALSDSETQPAVQR
jgi:vacuolar-type H+-ATPase subunit H